jgi:hypothetical protein
MVTWMSLCPAMSFITCGGTVVHPAVNDGRVLVTVPRNYADDGFFRRPHRGLVIGAVEDDQGVRLFGIDGRHARRRLRASAGGRLLIPRAYLLDDLTLGLLWATANLDAGLLDDDALLAEYREHLESYAKLPRSAAGRDAASDLTTVSQMWLGSDFCAKHILRHTDELSDVPVFWTSEQRGEEASTWLLFAHKYAYLQSLAERFAVSGSGLARAFCVPEEAVRDSARPERVLLLLSVALMESFGLRIDVCTDAEYSAVEGYVLEPSRRAIVANWVRTDSIWLVDVTDNRPSLWEYSEASGQARAHSVTAGADSAARLRALAAFLDLDWSWIVQRFAELAECGSAGLIQPRSRLMSAAGVDRACRFLGEMKTGRY